MTPTAPASPCSQPGCFALVAAGGRCPVHRPKPWQRPPTSTTQRGYGWRWQQLRKQVLQEEPACRLCGALSSEVDHIIPKRDGGTDARSNLRGLCTRCHQRITGQTKAGGPSQPPAEAPVTL